MKYIALVACGCATHRETITTQLNNTQIFDQIDYVHSTDQLLNAGLEEHGIVVFRDMHAPLDATFDWRSALDSQDASKHIPLIALTYGDQLEQKVHAFDTGANDCIGIDAELDEISARIRLQLRSGQRIKELYEAKRLLSRQALTDPLTGLYNRAYFDANLQTELARCQRSGKPFSLMMLDLDHFKQINDSHGHAYGDEILKMTATTLKDGLRTSDVLCRFGGEEFCVLLPETPTPFAYILARRLHKRVICAGEAAQRLDTPLTISIGISTANKKGVISAQELLSQADSALYAAKQNGRNRSEVFTPQHLAPASAAMAY